MIKKFILIIILGILLNSCGVKGPPKYEENKTVFLKPTE